VSAGAGIPIWRRKKTTFKETVQLGSVNIVKHFTYMAGIKKIINFQYLDIQNIYDYPLNISTNRLRGPE
jgi:hypothetical protein